MLALGLCKKEIHKRTWDNLNKTKPISEDLVLGVNVLNRFGTFS